MKFILVLFFTLFSSSSFALFCVQNGGNVPCIPAELTYYSGAVYGKDPEALKSNLVNTYCSQINQNYLTYCGASPSIRFNDLNNSPQYNYELTVIRGIPGETQPNISNYGGHIGSTQTCPYYNYGVERKPNTWPHFCYQGVYNNIYPLSRKTPSFRSGISGCLSLGSTT